MNMNTSVKILCEVILDLKKITIKCNVFVSTHVYQSVTKKTEKMYIRLLVSHIRLIIRI